MRTWLETREVLAGAYANQRLNQRLLTHAVVVSDAGDGEVLCRRVLIDNIADRYAGNDLKAEPTCAACRRAAKRWKEPR